MRLLARLTAALIFTIGAGQIGAAGLDELPADTQKLYAKNMLDPVQPVGESAYRNWKPKKGPPWTIGYASSYAGNTWRAGVMDRLRDFYKERTTLSEKKLNKLLKHDLLLNSKKALKYGLVDELFV